jgi:hypothetical protein
MHLLDQVNENYLLEVSRYLHLNPVRGVMLGQGTPIERREGLREYRWVEEGLRRGKCNRGQSKGQQFLTDRHGRQGGHGLNIPKRITMSSAGRWRGRLCVRDEPNWSRLIENLGRVPHDRLLVRTWMADDNNDVAIQTASGMRYCSTVKNC